MSGSGFMFNFSLESEEGNGNGQAAANTSSGGNGAGKSPASTVECKPSTSSSPDSVPRRSSLTKQIPVLPQHQKILDCTSPNIYSIPGSGIKLSYICGQQAYDIASASDDDQSGMELKSLLAMSDSQHSDLIPGVYEGGLKVWECALDLIQFLWECEIDLTGMQILELGCGTALPGIYALIRGAKWVDFQDYNPEVLNYITIPNVVLNKGTTTLEQTEDENRNEPGQRSKFYSGDWSLLPSLLEPAQTYDMILTSETIYSLESQPKLLNALKHLVRPGTGVAYVAAKSFYFGVGGSASSFCQLLEEDGTFSVSQCRTVEASVPRVILKLTQKMS